MKFKELEIKDKKIVNEYLNIDGAVMSDRTFASLYIWREHYKIGWCIEDGFLFIRNKSLEYNMYYMPMGRGDISKAVKRIYETEGDTPFFIALITKDRVEEIQNCLDGTAKVFETPEEYDYIYDAQSLINLQGKKYQSKRNFVNRFKAEYEGRWKIEEVDPKRDTDEILAFLENWTKSENRNEEDYIYECQAVKTALENYEELDFTGAKLLLDGRIIAFTLAAKQNGEVMDVLIEKAVDITGAYQMINREFAQNFCAQVKYINREEDLGIEGLKRAKLSYRPLFLTEKYVAECNRTKA